MSSFPVRQDKLMTYIDEALVSLEAAQGKMPTVLEVLVYLRDTYGITVGNEIIKKVGDDVLAVRRQDEEVPPT